MAPRPGATASPKVAVAVLVAVWADAVLVGGLVTAPPLVWRAAMFVHLAALVVGIGGVVAVDVLGLRWLRGRRTLGDVLRVGADVEAPIWLGYAGLLLSGSLLAPDLGNPLMWLKLLMVLGIGLGGLNAYRLRRALALYPALLTVKDAPPDLVRQLVIGAAISQAGWWAALFFGLLGRLIS